VVEIARVEGRGKYQESIGQRSLIVFHSIFAIGYRLFSICSRRSQSDGSLR